MHPHHTNVFLQLCTPHIKCINQNYNYYKYLPYNGFLTLRQHLVTNHTCFLVHKKLHLEQHNTGLNEVFHVS